MMSIWLGLRFRLRTAFNRGAFDQETRAELADHVARQTRKHIDEGMDPETAARIAALELGGIGRWRDDTAEVRSGRFLEQLGGDCRYVVRGLIARPWFAITALTSLAIGLGAATAIYTVVNGALMASLPYHDPSRLMSLSVRMPRRTVGDMVDMTWSYPKFIFLRDHQRSFVSLSLFSPETVIATWGDGAQRLPGEAVSAAYFDLLGTTPQIGRVFSPEEDRVGGPSAVVIVSDALWRNRFGARHDVIGQIATIAGVKHTIIGVMPPSFSGLSGDSQLWLPAVDTRSAASLAAPGAHNLQLVGRLASNASVASAKQEVAALGAQIDATFPDDDGQWGAAAYSFDDRRVNPAIRRSLELLSMAALLVLLIVSVNLTTLFLTRGTGRRVEFAIRLALGAGRGRVARQIMTETIIVSLLGACIGILLAIVAVRVLATTLPVAAPVVIGSGLNFTRVSFAGVHVGAAMVLVALGAALCLGFALGAIVAMRVTGALHFDALRQGVATAVARRQSIALRGGLVMIQIALAVVLLIVSGMTVESLKRTLATPLGYRTDGLLSVKLTLDPARVATDSADALWREIIERVRALPGVESVGAGDCTPIGDHCDGTSISPVGHGSLTPLAYRRVSPTYFQALGTPLVRGRFFTGADVAERRPVAIINRAAAREIWGNADPLTTPVAGSPTPIDVVGIVDDARYGDLERPPEPAMFVPFRGTRGGLFVRVRHDPASYTASIRAAVRAAGTGHAMANVQIMENRLHDATARSRLTAQVFSAFAASALLLAAIGVYGTLALTVVQRAREFAIRRALGADIRSLLAIVAAQAAGLAGVGILVGAVLALVASRALASVLYGVRMLEPAVYVQSGALLLAALVAASIPPVIRSARVDPKEAMKAE
jgi:putative ABC transport system permease protein